MLFFIWVDGVNMLPVWLSVPSEFSEIIKKPWTPVTYMFLHTGFIHLLFNILGLYWFGKLFLYHLDGDKLLECLSFGWIIRGSFLCSCL